MKRANHILVFLIGSITVFFVTAVIFIKNQFGEVPFDQLLFLLTDKGEGANTDIVVAYIRYAAVFFILFVLAFILISLLVKQYKDKFEFFKYVTDNKEHPQAGNRIVVLLFVVCALGTSLFVNDNLHISAYMQGKKTQSYLYERYYKDPEKVELKFPEKKQNLIYIFLESMESNFNQVKVDGEVVNLIPELELIARENTHFSNSEKLGGPYTMSGLSWTAASLVGQTSGVPLEVSMHDDDSYEEKETFLPGVKTLGEILKENGYKNYFMIGSDGNFGSRKTYFKTHGEYEIMDLLYMREIGKVPEDYNVFWGYEDSRLFAFAQEKLTEISKSDEPFNFTMLTVDTHFMDGYVDETDPVPFSVEYANAILNSDTKLAAFIRWIQKQDFYEDTTIILCGDHESMNDKFNKTVVDPNLTLYNTFINPRVQAEKMTNREFSVLDMFPSTLAALGVEIEGDKLGLGVNLFSNQLTLVEFLGADQLNLEIGMKSNFYEKKFLQLDSTENK